MATRWAINTERIGQWANEWVKLRERKTRSRPRPMGKTTCSFEKVWIRILGIHSFLASLHIYIAEWWTDWLTVESERLLTLMNSYAFSRCNFLLHLHPHFYIFRCFFLQFSPSPSLYYFFCETCVVWILDTARISLSSAWINEWVNQCSNRNERVEWIKRKLSSYVIIIFTRVCTAI